MDTKVNYTLLGAFVILLCAATVLIIIWLASGFSIGEYTLYQVDMQEAVTGLSVDAVVEFNGVNVGAVKKISISQRNPHLVLLLLNVRHTTPVTQGTIATLNSRGLTGITYIALKDKGTDLRPLVALPGQPYPVIKTEPSFFLQLDKTLNKLGMNFSKISESINTLLNPENQQSIRQILINLNQITATLASNTQKMNLILTNTSKASEKLPALIQSSGTTMQMLQSQSIPALNRTLANFDNVARNFSDISMEIKQNPALLIRGKQPQPLGPGEK